MRILPTERPRARDVALAADGAGRRDALLELALLELADAEGAEDVGAAQDRRALGDLLANRAHEVAKVALVAQDVVEADAHGL